jgi:hypothetical protein
MATAALLEVGGGLCNLSRGHGLSGRGLGVRMVTVGISEGVGF